MGMAAVYSRHLCCSVEGSDLLMLEAMDTVIKVISDKWIRGGLCVYNPMVNALVQIYITT